MINTNTNRWQSVRLLFDKHIIGRNLKCNYQQQQSGVGGAVLARLVPGNLTMTLNGAIKERQSSAQVDIKGSSSGLDQSGLFKWAVSALGSHGADKMCLMTVSVIWMLQALPLSRPTRWQHNQLSIRKFASDSIHSINKSNFTHHPPLERLLSGCSPYYQREGFMNSNLFLSCFLSSCIKSVTNNPRTENRKAHEGTLFCNSTNSSPWKPHLGLVTFNITSFLKTKNRKYCISSSLWLLPPSYLCSKAKDRCQQHSFFKNTSRKINPYVCLIKETLAVRFSWKLAFPVIPCSVSLHNPAEGPKWGQSGWVGGLLYHFLKDRSHFHPG